MSQTTKSTSQAFDLSVSLADSLAAKGQPAAFLDGLAKAYRATAGWDMLTLMTFNLKTRMARRIYTTDQANYPVSTEKPMTDSDFADLVLKRGQVFVANTVEEFKPHYIDWEKLKGLRLESAINYPAIVGGETIGTVNLTAAKGFYTPERVAAGKALMPYAALGFLLLDRATL